MAVLIQQVVEATYAFVIHTVNPCSGNRDELYVEAVPGLGETLVSNWPGRALRVVCQKRGGGCRVLAYPSKAVGLYGKGLIFRSDSSAEDLAGYAAAGLYDSVMLEPPCEVPLDYTQDCLINDEGFRQGFLARMVEIGVSVEKVMGRPQDIEGAYAEGNFYVLQSRPQVGTNHE